MNKNLIKDNNLIKASGHFRDEDTLKEIKDIMTSFLKHENSVKDIKDNNLIKDIKDNLKKIIDEDIESIEKDIASGHFRDEDTLKEIKDIMTSFKHENSVKERERLTLELFKIWNYLELRKAETGLVST